MIGAPAVAWEYIEPASAEGRWIIRYTCAECCEVIDIPASRVEADEARLDVFVFTHRYCREVKDR